MTLLALFADQAAIALESVQAFGDLGRVLFDRGRRRGKC